jgi:hypothetical protein
MHEHSDAEPIAAIPHFVEQRGTPGPLPCGTDVGIGENSLDQSSRPVLANSDGVRLGRSMVPKQRAQSMDRHVRE